MAEGRPPYAEVHPMRAIFMIPTKPSPTLKEQEPWSGACHEFIAKCLIKNPVERPSATSLLKQKFITSEYHVQSSTLSTELRELLKCVHFIKI